RLVQDVAGFCDFLEQASQRLRAQFAELANLSVDTLAARLVGRWPSGAPLSRSPMKDDPAMGADDLVSNNFLFKEATPELDIGSSGQKYPSIPGDPSCRERV